MKPQVISFHCVLKNSTGKMISSTFNRDVITNCPRDPLPGLSEGLRNLKAGEKRQITLPASQAFGFYNPNLVIEVPRKRIAYMRKLKVGDEFLFPDQDNKLRSFRVIEEDRRTVTLDGNHPLAGQDLIFDVEGVQIRDATQEEIEASSTKYFKQSYH